MNDLTDYLNNLQTISRMNDETRACIDLLGGNMKNRVQVNFGGLHYDIPREQLVKDPSIGWNLLSCLLSKRWEEFLLQDKRGRIFFDYELEWIKPLLDAIRGHSVSLTDIPCEKATRKLCSHFLIKERRVFGGLPVVIDDLQYSIASKPSEFVPLWKEIAEVFGSRNFYGTRLYSSDFHPKASWLTWEPIPHTVTSILIQLTTGEMYVSLIEKGFDFSSRKDGNILVRLLRPLKLIQGACNVGNPVTLANLRIGLEGTIELSTDLRKDQWHGLKKVHKLEVYSIQELSGKPSEERLESLGTESADSMKSVDDSLHQSSVELRFIQSCVYDLWKDLIPGFPSPPLEEEPSSLNETSIQSYLTYFEAVLPMITQFKETLKSASGEERRRIDPLAYFNVEGNLFVTRKSTILEVFPDSQLAVRVSGRWTEQEQDIDEDGNIYYDVSPEAFKSVIRYMRERKLLGSSAVMIVKKEIEKEVKELLEYLMIDASATTIKSR